MSFEDLQSKWQSHDHCMPLRIDPSLLLNEVRRSHRAMESNCGNAILPRWLLQRS